MINKLIADGTLNELGLVIVDELHFVADASRGALLEQVLTKLRYLSKGIQLVGMSATLPNCADLAKWLHAACYVSTYRPVPLAEVRIFAFCLVIVCQSGHKTTDA